MDHSQHVIGNMSFMPHGHCYLWMPSLVWTMVMSDLLIGIAYVSISISLYALIRKIKMPFHLVFLAFGLFIFACGGTHFMEVYTLWVPDYWTSAAVKVVTAIASVATAIVLYPLRSKIIAFAEAARISEERGLQLEDAYQDLERHVEERTAELSQAIRARDDFLSIASHELKTPLTSLSLQAQMQLRKLEAQKDLSPDELRKLVNNTNKQVGRLIRLVDDMLDISRIQTGKFAITIARHDFAEVLRESVERLQHQATTQSVRIQLKAPDRCPGFFDQIRLEQVLGNLMTNALKFGGKSDIFVSLECREQNVLICVRDEGPGIEKENHDRIFHRFERLSASASGLGLGLFISRQILEAHGGKMWVESEVGVGTSFYLDFPLRPDNLSGSSAG